MSTLAEETAKELASHHGGTLSLNGLTSLSDGAVVVLAAHDGHLSLNGLKSLSDQSAAALGKHKRDWLILDGLTSLTDEGARSLAQHAGIVSLKGLQTVSDSAQQALKANSRIALGEKLRAAGVHTSAKIDGKFVGAFLKAHCTSCHGGDSKEGDFSMDRLTFDNMAGRVAFASILERLRGGDMPPNVEDRPDPMESAGVVQWISSRLDASFKGPVTQYAVKESPVDGNRLPHAILFGGPRGPSVPPPPRLWRLSPSAYTKSLSGFNVNGLQQPFGQIPEAGFKDFSALYAPDEGATGLILANAEQVVLAQTKSHLLVNIHELPPGKEALWPGDERIKTATPEERKELAKGDRVRQGNGIFAPLSVVLGLSSAQARPNYGAGYGALGCDYSGRDANLTANDPLFQTVDHTLASPLPGIIPVFGLGVHGDVQTVFANTVSASSPKRPLPMICQPEVAFQTLFGSVAEGDARRAFNVRNKLLDWTRADIRRVSRELSGTDREKLDAYLDTFEQMQTRQDKINAIQGNLQAHRPAIDKFNSKRMTDRFEAQGALAVAALASRLTNVVVLDASCGPHGYKTWTELGITKDGHSIGHSIHTPESAEFAVKIRRFHAERVADLARRMSAIKVTRRPATGPCPTSSCRRCTRWGTNASSSANPTANSGTSTPPAR